MVFEIEAQAVALEYIREGLLVGVFGPRVEKGEKERREESEEEEGSRGEEEGVEGKIWEAQKKAAGMAAHLREELKEFRMPAEME